MKLAKFTSRIEAENAMQELTNLAKHKSSTFTQLDAVNESRDGTFFWFNFSNCVDNGGLARGLIASKESDFDIHEFDEIPDFWERSEE